MRGSIPLRGAERSRRSKKVGTAQEHEGDHIHACRPHLLQPQRSAKTPSDNRSLMYGPSSNPQRLRRFSQGITAVPRLRSTTSWNLLAWDPRGGYEKIMFCRYICGVCASEEDAALSSRGTRRGSTLGALLQGAAMSGPSKDGNVTAHAQNGEDRERELREKLLKGGQTEQGEKESTSPAPSPARKEGSKVPPAPVE